MYITPDTTIKMLTKCPLDNTYNHTIYFNSVEAQTTYFNTLAKYTLPKQTYQRVNTNTMRVQLKADDLYDCNYLMFQNTAFGNKWFYAFIQSVEYVNNITSQITYELDVMQTWHFDYTLGECFIDREHAEKDQIGANTVPENLETGPYVTTAESNLQISGLNAYMLLSEALDGAPWAEEPGLVGGFPIPCYWARLGSVSSFSSEVIKLIIDQYTAAGKAEAILAIFTAPSNMVSTTESVRINNFRGATRTLTYTPKNNKLYTYPYCCLTLSALGEGSQLRYELFDANPMFRARGGFGPNMQVACSPLNYAGQSENLEYTVTIKDFPICAWVSNYFQNWLAQNKANIAVNTITGLAGNIMQGVASYAAGNPLGVVNAAVNGVGNIAGQLASVYQHSIIPDKMTGSANAADIMAVSGLSGFYTRCKAIRPEYAKIIDDYFTMFGYKTNRVKVPNRNVRDHWTYTKTVGCVVKGSVPADDMNKICQIYNNGITFWKNGNEIGNYSLNNEVQVG